MSTTQDILNQAAPANGYDCKQAFNRGKSLLFVFKGRATRSEFWWFTLALIIINFLISFVLQLLANVSTSADALDSVITLVFAVIHLALACRRLHDVDKSGWWQALPYALMIPGLILMAVFMDAGDYTSLAIGNIFAVVGVILAFAAWIYLIFLYCTKGTSGPNRFGEDPYRTNNISQNPYDINFKA